MLLTLLINTYLKSIKKTVENHMEKYIIKLITVKYLLSTIRKLDKVILLKEGEKEYLKWRNFNEI
jgi:hypothetical protein